MNPNPPNLCQPGTESALPSGRVTCIKKGDQRRQKRGGYGGPHRQSFRPRSLRENQGHRPARTLFACPKPSRPPRHLMQASKGRKVTHHPRGNPFGETDLLLPGERILQSKRGVPSGRLRLSGKNWLRALLGGGGKPAFQSHGWRGDTPLVRDLVGEREAQWTFGDKWRRGRSPALCAVQSSAA